LQAVKPSTVAPTSATGTIRLIMLFLYLNFYRG
jgi:hypothetical protein